VKTKKKRKREKERSGNKTTTSEDSPISSQAFKERQIKEICKVPRHLQKATTQYSLLESFRANTDLYKVYEGNPHKEEKIYKRGNHRARCWMQHYHSEDVASKIEGS